MEMAYGNYGPRVSSERKGIQYMLLLAGENLMEEQ